jgi:hypothetical protein
MTIGGRGRRRRNGRARREGLAVRLAPQQTSLGLAAAACPNGRSSSGVGAPHFLQPVLARLPLLAVGTARQILMCPVEEWYKVEYEPDVLVPCVYGTRRNNGRLMMRTWGYFSLFPWTIHTGGTWHATSAKVATRQIHRGHSRVRTTRRAPGLHITCMRQPECLRPFLSIQLSSPPFFFLVKKSHPHLS